LPGVYFLSVCNPEVISTDLLVGTIRVVFTGTPMGPVFLDAWVWGILMTMLRQYAHERECDGKRRKLARLLYGKCNAFTKRKVPETVIYSFSRGAVSLEWNSFGDHISRGTV
jgi:hypothetical protein